MQKNILKTILLSSLTLMISFSFVVDVAAKQTKEIDSGDTSDCLYGTNFSSSTNFKEEKIYNESCVDNAYFCLTPLPAFRISLYNGTTLKKVVDFFDVTRYSASENSKAKARWLEERTKVNSGSGVDLDVARLSGTEAIGFTTFSSGIFTGTFHHKYLNNNTVALHTTVANSYYSKFREWLKKTPTPVGKKKECKEDKWKSVPAYTILRKMGYSPTKSIDMLSSNKYVFLIEPLFALKVQLPQDAVNWSRKWNWYVGTAYTLTREMTSDYYYNKCLNTTYRGSKFTASYCKPIFKERGFDSKSAQGIRMANSIHFAKGKDWNGLVGVPKATPNNTKASDVTKRQNGYGIALIKYKTNCGCDDCDTPDDTPTPPDPQDQQINPPCYKVNRNNCSSADENYTASVDVDAKDEVTNAATCGSSIDTKNSKYTSSKYGAIETGNVNNVILDNKYCALYCEKEMSIEVPDFGERKGTFKRNNATLNMLEEYKITKKQSYTCKVDIKRYYGDTSSSSDIGKVYGVNQKKPTKAEADIATAVIKLDNAVNDSAVKDFCKNDSLSVCATKATAEITRLEGVIARLNREIEELDVKIAEHTRDYNTYSSWVEYDRDIIRSYDEDRSCALKNASGRQCNCTVTKDNDCKFECDSDCRQSYRDDANYYYAIAHGGSYCFGTGRNRYCDRITYDESYAGELSRDTKLMNEARAKKEAAQRERNQKNSERTEAKNKKNKLETFQKAYNKWDSTWTSVQQAYASCTNQTFSVESFVGYAGNVVVTDSDGNQLTLKPQYHSLEYQDDETKTEDVTDGISGLGISTLSGDGQKISIATNSEYDCASGNHTKYWNKYDAVCMTKRYYERKINERKSFQVARQTVWQNDLALKLHLNDNDPKASKTDPNNDTVWNVQSDKLGNGSLNYCKWDASRANDVFKDSGISSSANDDMNKINFKFEDQHLLACVGDSADITLDKSSSQKDCACPSNTYHAGENAYSWVGSDELSDEVENQFKEGLLCADAVDLVCNDESLPENPNGYEEVENDEHCPMTDCLLNGLSYDTCNNHACDRYTCQMTIGNKKKNMYIQNDVYRQAYIKGLKSVNDKDPTFENQMKSIANNVCKQKTSGECNEEFVYRVVELNDGTTSGIKTSFPGLSGNGRRAGSNWTDKWITKSLGTKSVDESKPMYRIELTPDKIKKIREYNKVNPYVGYATFNCNKNNAACVSQFLNGTSTVGSIVNVGKSSCANVTSENFYACNNY